MDFPVGGSLAPPPAVDLMRKLGLEPDPWQVDVLEGDYSRLLLNCCRQSGKSTAVAMLALAQAVFVPFTTVLLISRSGRQSSELFRIVRQLHRRLGSPLVRRDTALELELRNFSRVVCLPCKEETIRGFSKVSLLIIDEAARVPDELFGAVSPMLAVSDGRLICLSTPYGRHGFFYEAWAGGGDDWKRIQIAAHQVSRIKKSFLERERRTIGEARFRQEYECSFEALEGLVYPDFSRCVVPGPAPQGRRFGGIDFGFRNPFAAVWGVVDHDDVLWLTGEHFSREKTLAFHVQHLPRGITWYADPQGPREIQELRCADVAVRPGDNEIKIGIAAVRARLEEGALKVVAGSCPNLLDEAGRYRYGSKSKGEDPEKPVKECDHALDALRYMISRLDARRMARLRHGPKANPVPPAEDAEGDCPPASSDQAQPPIPGSAQAPSSTKPNPPPPAKTKDNWLRLDNEQLWTRLY
jgi:hypothetical protein